MFLIESCLVGLSLLAASSPAEGSSRPEVSRAASAHRPAEHRADRVADLEAFLQRQGRPPADYLLAKLAEHRLVIVGENHWVRRDVETIASLLPQLRRRRVALAMEFLRADSQSDLDSLLAAPEWNETLANRILRVADWPYVQYRDLLHAAWSANRELGPPLRVVGLGPPPDWREKNLHYDSYMAERVAAYVAEPGHRVLVYCGMHHAFTRFLQVDRMQGGRPTQFMERMGNILWRRLGAEVFLIALHKPEPCGGWSDESPAYCAPLGGVIDCAASRAGGRPVGFDILRSPLAEWKIEPPSFYALGHPLLRMIDYADGYVWQEPVDETVLVDLIPLADYSPEDAADESARNQWEEMARDLARPQHRHGWRNLWTWRATCDLEGSPN